MKLRTKEFIHESKVSIDSAFSQFTQINSMTAPSCSNFFNGVELCIKAYSVEQHGSIPKNLRTHDLVTLCQSNGLWNNLSNEIKRFLHEMNIFQPQVTRYPGEEGYNILITSSTNDWWKEAFSKAYELIKLVKSHVD